MARALQTHEGMTPISTVATFAQRLDHGLSFSFCDEQQAMAHLVENKKIGSGRC